MTQKIHPVTVSQLFLRPHADSDTLRRQCGRHAHFSVKTGPKNKNEKLKPWIYHEQLKDNSLLQNFSAISQELEWVSNYRKTLPKHQ